jgi:hypothetical protein
VEGSHEKATKAQKAVNKTEKVNAFMDELDHPFKAEVQAVRDIITPGRSRRVSRGRWLDLLEEARRSRAASRTQLALRPSSNRPAGPPNMGLS